ncbi:hypothetical protein POM88_045495 [Heracleum sosnowskyi]|uniref:Uncharacterized protein n=1 Tax=Heracleum sosnowskyi TaxID=360622 RepID=A0AAD8M501_9APIA|nr:hypothetical protein POM88_045495 [Heracleum sosnowskyi]
MDNFKCRSAFLSCDQCRFFRWLDDPLYERARVIIPGLIRRNNNLEAQQKRVEYRSFGGCSGEIEGNSSEIGGCSSGCMSSSTTAKENNSGINITLTLLIVTWIAIFVYSLCKIEEVE